MQFALAISPNAALPVAGRKWTYDAGFEDPTAEKKPLYVRRPLTNADALIAWAKAAGFKTVMSPEDMHATLAYSKVPVDWSAAGDPPESSNVTIDGGDTRTVEVLGDDGAVVLRFESEALTADWQRLRDAGAEWKHDAFRPHVTFTYEPGDVDLATVTPYDGPLEFGPEVFEEITERKFDASKVQHIATDSALKLAMDRDSVREKTRDGRLVVHKANITKANVCGYRGSEIPGWQTLGLDPDRVYNLLRAPDELQKAADSLNGVQLLRKHIPISAEDHQPYDTVGSLGSHAEWNDPYLTNSLYVNAKDAIDGIETGQKRELSAGYHYKPDMTPGIFNGKAFDGTMRDIVFNHVALVVDGRAGPDVVVGDEALREHDMLKATRFGAMTLSLSAAAIAPLLAMDSKVTLPKDLFSGLTTKNFKDNRAKLLEGVRTSLDGKLRPGLALDASMTDFAKAIDAFKDDVDADINEPAPAEKAAAMEKVAEVAAPTVAKEIADKTSNDSEPLRAFLKERGISDEDIAKAMGMISSPAANDEGDKDDEESEEEKKKRADALAAAKDTNMKDMVSKPAMDEALAAQSKNFEKRLADVQRNAQGVRVALGEVKAYVGEIPSTMAFDSATEVYRHALTMRQVDGAKTLHADALLPILKSLSPIGARPAHHQADTSLAMDASTITKARALAPGLEHISTVS